MTPILQATDIHKTYTLPHKHIHVLNGATLTVNTGQRIAIIGRSGAGKSTLLNVLGGLDKPDTGTVTILGQPIYQLPPRKRTTHRAQHLGFVFQSYQLLPEMDVTENVMPPAMTRAHPTTPTQMRQRAQELLDLVGLTDRMNHTPLELSGGEQQRAALARALMNDPTLIFADEPTGNLDRLTGTQIIDMLFTLTRTRDLSVIMVTHSTDTATLCDHIYELQNGQLIPTPTN